MNILIPIYQYINNLNRPVTSISYTDEMPTLIEISDIELSKKDSFYCAKFTEENREQYYSLTNWLNRYNLYFEEAAHRSEHELKYSGIIKIEHRSVMMPQEYFYLVKSNNLIYSYNYEDKLVIVRNNDFNEEFDVRFEDNRSGNSSRMILFSNSKKRFMRLKAFLDRNKIFYYESIDSKFFEYQRIITISERNTRLLPWSTST